MKTAIRKHLGDFIAILALFVLALGVGVYILSQQRLRFPLVQEKTFRVQAVLPNAQAVTPGQGQTVRVAGVEVGQIGKVELEEGRAVVNLELEPKYKTLLKRDATALLRSKTGVKDMFIEVDPGEDSRAMPEKGRIRVENTEQDVDPDEVLAALDTDTRDYLRLLISGAGKGLKGRGSDLRETFARFGPIHRDLARTTKAIADRRRNMRRLIHNYGVLMAHLGRNDKELTRLVRSSAVVFDSFASEDQNISTAVARLPGALNQTASTLRKVDPYSRRLDTSLQALRPGFRQLEETNREIIPAVREGAPILRNQIRPFARTARPFTRKFGRSAKNLAGAAPELSKSFLELNRLFNIGAYNPNGREGLPGDLAGQRARDEGYLYWLAWTAQNTTSLFSTSDANGPFRRFYLGGLGCGTLRTVLPPGPQTDVTLGLLSPEGVPADTLAPGSPALPGAGVCAGGPNQ